MRRSVSFERFIKSQRNLFKMIIKEIKDNFICYLLGNPDKKIMSRYLLSIPFADINATGDLIIYDISRNRNLLAEIVSDEVLLVMCIVDPSINGILSDETIFDIRLLIERYFDRINYLVESKLVTKLKHLQPYINVSIPNNIKNTSISSIISKEDVYLSVQDIGDNIGNFLFIDNYSYQRKLWFFEDEEPEKIIFGGSPVMFRRYYTVNYWSFINGEKVSGHYDIKFSLLDAIYGLNKKDDETNN